MDVDRPRLDEAILTPDEVEQLVSTEDTPGLRHERGEQGELLRGEGHRPPPDRHFEAVAVDQEVTGLEAVALGLELGRLAAPDDRLDAGHELPGRVRLGPVVVRPHLDVEARSSGCPPGWLELRSRGCRAGVTAS